MGYIEDMSDSPLSHQVPQFVGDNLALDFINTQFGVGPALRECLADDAGVVRWLQQAQVLADDFAGSPKGLLKLALELRASARALVDAAKSDADADADAEAEADAAVDVVNRVLEAGRAANALKWDGVSKSYKLVAQRRHDNAASLLEPVAQALVKLLTDTPLELVRECEAHDCTLMFHDLTKSHRRRWCSMAVCGNRMKVAAFRSRKKTE